MKSLLNNVNNLDDLIRQLHKMESKMRSGQWIDAWRELNRVIAHLTANKQKLIEKAAELADKESKEVVGD